MNHHRSFSFWKEHWQRNDTPWASRTADEMFVGSYPQLVQTLGAAGTAPALVPLCGHSHAVRFLYERGHQVTAIEYVPEAMQRLQQESFPDVVFSERAPAASDGARLFQAERLVLHQCDFFSLGALGPFALIYDRGAFAAIEPELRTEYGRRVAQWSRVDGLLYLAAAEIEGADFAGPPNSVTKADVARFFSGFDCIACEEKLDSPPPPHLAELGAAAIHYRYYTMRRGLREPG